MRNDEVAQVFERIADLLTLQGDEGFKVRAYQRAARAIEQFPVPVEQLVREGRLGEIPGVGQAIGEKITELVATGRLAYYERLAAEFPPGLLTLLEVPGIGPKTALLVSQALGVSTVEELEAAALDGRLAALPRMGEKAVENILKAVQSARHKETRRPLGKAVPVAEEVTALLQGMAGLTRVAPAGSLRRQRETVGDLDLVGVGDDPNTAIEAFTRLPLVRQVIAAGDKKASVLVEGDFQVDFRVVPPEQWGSMLQHGTGSKEHNVLLQERARRMGLSLSEDGITRLADGVLETFATEEAFYARLGLPWIPPELREGGSEIDLAAEGRLPQLIALRDIAGDLHVHSDWSDGAEPLEAMVQGAIQRGYVYVALTDHSAGRGIARGLTVERLRAQRREIEALQARYPQIVILHGSEVDIRADGSLDYADEVLAWLDFTVASVHSAMQQEEERMTARIIRAMENPYVSCIGHLTTRLLGERPPIAVDLDAVLQAAIRTGTALEINASPDRLDLSDVHAQRARLLGVPLVISTDAHSLRGLDFMRFGVGVARRAWCAAADILNTRPWPAFQAFMEAKRRAAVGQGQR